MYNIDDSKNLFVSSIHFYNDNSSNNTYVVCYFLSIDLCAFFLSLHSLRQTAIHFMNGSQQTVCVCLLEIFFSFFLHFSLSWFVWFYFALCHTARRRRKCHRLSNISLYSKNASTCMLLAFSSSSSAASSTSFNLIFGNSIALKSNGFKAPN